MNCLCQKLRQEARIGAARADVEIAPDYSEGGPNLFQARNRGLTRLIQPAKSLQRRGQVLIPYCNVAHAAAVITGPLTMLKFKSCGIWLRSAWRISRARTPASKISIRAAFSKRLFCHLTIEARRHCKHAVMPLWLAKALHASTAVVNKMLPQLSFTCGHTDIEHVGR